MEKHLLIAAAVAAAFILSSCSVAQPHVAVIQGNYAFGQGRFQAATVDYLRAMDRGQYEQWIAYDLGNVYHALGETVSALQMWDRAGNTSDRDLLFGVSFNRGVLYYELGRYEKAYDQFKLALKIDSASVDAKRNLELSLRKIEAGENIQKPAQSTASGNKGDVRDEAGRVLEYIRRKEGERWYATEQAPAQSSNRDW